MAKIRGRKGHIGDIGSGGGDIVLVRYIYMQQLIAAKLSYVTDLLKNRRAKTFGTVIVEVLNEMFGEDSHVVKEIIEIARERFGKQYE